MRIPKSNKMYTTKLVTAPTAKACGLSGCFFRKEKTELPQGGV